MRLQLALFFRSIIKGDYEKEINSNQYRVKEKVDIKIKAQKYYCDHKRRKQAAFGK
jgi:hypothetical protein